MKQAARKLALMCGATFLSLALAECAFRVHLAREAKGSDDSWRDDMRKMNGTIYRRSEDATLVYEPVPNATVAMPYGPAGFSAQSMRDDRTYANEPAPDNKRVAIIGDSIVWGEDLPLESTLPRALARELGPRFEVLGFGVTGYDSVQEAEWYRTHVRAFHPAIVVVVYCLNDLFIASGPFNKWATPEELRAKDEQDALVQKLAPIREETIEDISRDEEEHATFRLFARARTVWRVRRYEHDPAYTDEYLLLYGQKEKFDRTTGALSRLASDVRTDGAAAHLVISPILRSWDAYHWTSLHARIAEAARDAGFVVHDPREALRASHRERDVRTDSLHYNATGTTALASILAREIEK
jgi:lysophospholipase L1-like esterase